MADQPTAVQPTAERGALRRFLRDYGIDGLPKLFGPITTANPID
jgi:hypothetical protein